MHLTLCDYLLEILQNAVEAGAREVRLCCEETERRLRVEIADNGPGMTPAQLQRCHDPFYSGAGKHPGRSQGLGIPLLAQLLEATGGQLNLDSTVGRGTTVTLHFDLTHVDTPPLGDLAGCLADAMAFPGDYEFIAQRSLRTESGRAERAYRLSRQEILTELGSLTDWTTMAALRHYIRGLEAGLRQGAENESPAET